MSLFFIPLRRQKGKGVLRIQVSHASHALWPKEEQSFAHCVLLIYIYAALAHQALYTLNATYRRENTAVV